MTQVAQLSTQQAARPIVPSSSASMFALPPLEVYHGLKIFARTGGLLVFFPCQNARLKVTHSLGWVRSRHSNTWLNPRFPRHQLYFTDYPSGVHVLQHFDRRPDIHCAVSAGRDLLGAAASPSDVLSLPIRFRQGKPADRRGGYVDHRTGLWHRS